MMNRYALVGLLALLVGCGDTKPGTDETNDTTTAADTTPLDKPLSVDPASQDADDWLDDRYDPEHGTITLEVTTGGSTTIQKKYFTDHGAREALHWFYGGREAEGAVYRSLVENGTITYRGPADTAVMRQPWRADPAVTLPNFRHMTDTMRGMFALRDLPSKTILGRESQGYQMTIGETVSQIWVWEGIMMQGEIQGNEAKGIDPMLVRVTAIDTTRPSDALFPVE